MVRVKRGKKSHKRRKKLLKKVKGFKWGRKSRYALAKQALTKALTHAYIDRKRKKRNFRKLWQIQINAGCRKLGTNYSKFIHALKEKKIELDRKTLAELSSNYPEVFEELVKKISQ
ncbi:50S ribosomal protein L20 [Parcubacteria bacterium DG_74_2]|nr:MAG: 50S ribosomal protein L20 [Parcubacteria bacterium DG_74_2]